MLSFIGWSEWLLGFMGFAQYRLRRLALTADGDGGVADVEGGLAGDDAVT